MKIKKRKSQGHSTKSLQTFDNLTKRRKPFNSGEQLRTKSGGSFPFPDEDDDLDDNDSGTTRLRIPSGKLPKFEQPLNDRRFNILNAGSALPLDNQSKSYEDDDDDYDEDDPAKEALLEAYKQGEDAHKILDSWQQSKSKKSQQQKQSPASPDSPEQDPSVPHPGGKPLDSGLQARLPSQPRDLVAQIVKSRFVTLSWVEPLQNAGDVVYYTVYYKMNNSER